MKKLISILSIFVVAITLLSAQVLPEKGVSNTLSVTVGRPYGDVNDPNRPGVNFHGFIDTLQARVDISKFTIEGMLNWGALFYGGGFAFENTDKTPFYYSNSYRTGPFEVNALSDKYYVNFFFNPTRNFSIGVGTRLNWIIGPAPAYSAFLWQPEAHLRQGGLLDGNPPNVPNNPNLAVGYLHYANCYGRAAIGVKFTSDTDKIEIGASIPDGASTGHFKTNIAARVSPVSWFGISAALEIDWMDDLDIYTGAYFDFEKNLMLDVYLAIDNVAGASGDIVWGTGAALTLRFPKINLSLKPEVGLTFYENQNYTLAIYTGAKLTLGFEKFTFGLWGSFAWGAADRRWANSNAAKNYTGGFIFDIRPDITYQINKNHSVSAMFDFQYTSSYDRRNFNTWATSAYWTYKL